LTSFQCLLTTLQLGLLLLGSQSGLVISDRHGWWVGG
jgi:hypothetical protein